jgi:mannose-6-phosphate isomerase-like protein (cupin superfamily)
MGGGWLVYRLMFKKTFCGIPGRIIWKRSSGEQGSKLIPTYMLPQFYKVLPLPASTINVVLNKRHHFGNPFHFHPELEIILILKSAGFRFMGDSVEAVEAGDLVFIGANIPHCWRNESGYNNLANFIIQFKRIMQQTPRQYQAKFRLSGQHRPHQQTTGKD